MNQTLVWVGLLLVGGMHLGAAVSACAAPAYDPLEVSTKELPAPLELTANDQARNRELPLRVYLPADKQAAPVLLFSHGLGGSRQNADYLARHWSQRGYVVVCLQHPGSDEAVWKNQPLAKRWGALTAAANLENFRLRVDDVKQVLDQLEQWQKTKAHPLAGRLDLSQVGMSGHSFGGVTTQAVSGQQFGRGRISFTDPRIKAAVVMSPSPPRGGQDPKDSFRDVKIPWLLMTGTEDNSPIGKEDATARMKVFPALPDGHKYELVLFGAHHSAFGPMPLPGEGAAHQPNHHRVVLALSTAFWDAFLRNDLAALAWLDGDAPRQVLDPRDRFQKK